jgi:6-phosphofructokinase 1
MAAAEEKREKFQSETADRRQSIMPTMGQEGKFIAKNCFAGKTIAVFTSGGDAQGMQY